MKLEGEKGPEQTPPSTAMPLVGTGPIDDDSDSDSEPAVDMEGFTEEEDPVIYMYITDSLQTLYVDC